MKIEIETPSRLHLGFLNISRDMDRRFGSIGIALEKPRFKLRVCDEFTGIKFSESIKEDITSVINEYLDRFRRKTKVRGNFGIEILESIPRHVGLGSGTQLGMALGLALTKAFNLNMKLEEIAALMGRCKNSGAGFYCFSNGGLVIDSGSKANGFPKLIFRYKIPENWRFLLVTLKSKRGLYGEAEAKIFSEIDEPIAKKSSMKIARLVLLKLLPSLLEKDIQSFGEALTRIDSLTGRIFDKFQGGEYMKENQDIMDFLIDNSYGAGQSSWGPCCYGLILYDEIDKTLKKAKAFLRRKKLKADLLVTKARNHGYKLRVID